jgi:hypothetical protein
MNSRPHDGGTYAKQGKVMKAIDQDIAEFMN